MIVEEFSLLRNSHPTQAAGLFVLLLKGEALPLLILLA
jgi:hypothetical protein